MSTAHDSVRGQELYPTASYQIVIISIVIHVVAGANYEDDIQAMHGWTALRMAKEHKSYSNMGKMQKRNTMRGGSCVNLHCQGYHPSVCLGFAALYPASGRFESPSGFLAFTRTLAQI